MRVYEGIRLDGEILAGIPAAIGSRLARRGAPGRSPSRIRGNGRLGPVGLDEPAFGRRVVGKHPGGLDQRETLAEVLAGCLVRHHPSPKYGKRFWINRYIISKRKQSRLAAPQEALSRGGGTMTPCCPFRQ